MRTIIGEFGPKALTTETAWGCPVKVGRVRVEQHPDLINAAYGLTEAGASTLYFAKTKIYAIQVAEKGVTWMKIRARGEPGHGSLPYDQNAVLYLAQAPDSIGRARYLPVHLAKPRLAGQATMSAQTGDLINQVEASGQELAHLASPDNRYV